MSAITAKPYARPFSAPVTRPLPGPKPAAASAPGSRIPALAPGWQPAAVTTAVQSSKKPATASAARPGAPGTAKNADLRLDVFDSAQNWKTLYVGPRYGDPLATSAPFAERVSQRYFVVQGQPSLGPDGAIYTETKQVVKAPAERILAQLRDPHFWNNGSVDHWVAKPDGSFTYALWPAGKMAGVKVNETMHPPERQADGSYIVRIDLSRKGDGSQLMPGQVEGRAYIVVKPRSDGSCEVSGRFAGVQEFSPLFSAESFAKNHLLGERGELKGKADGVGFINHLMPNGTGFGAMLQRAEQAPR
jgi:hypothetical protein